MSLLARLPRLPMPAAFQPVQPPLAAEIGERGVTLVRVSRSGGRATVAGFHHGELAEGALRLSAVQPNVHDPAAVRAQVKAAKARVAPSGGAVALCVPDPVARVAILRLDAMPARDAEVQELVSWRLKKQLPYRVDEARVAWSPLAARGGGTTVLAAAMRRRVLAEYEDLLESEGFEVGSVTTSTLALAEALPASSQDTLLVHAADGWFSLLWSDAAHPLLLRTKQLPSSDREGASRDEAVAAEIAPTIEYGRQRLGRTQDLRLLVHDASGRSDELAQRIERAVELPASVLPIPAAGGLPAGVPERIAAACGLAARGLPGAEAGGAGR